MRIKKQTASSSLSKERFVELIGCYDIDWIYRPVSFSLQADLYVAGERLCPDFYLPRQDTYIVVASFFGKLLDKFAQRSKKLKRLYPHIDIRVLSPKDFPEFIRDCI